MKCIDFDLKINKVHAALVRAQCFLRNSEAHALHQLSNSSGMLLFFFPICQDIKLLKENSLNPPNCVNACALFKYM